MEPGQIIAKGISLSRPLGQGGMGAVWLANHLALETEVVVKFMHEALGEDAGSRERFSREAVAASQVKSPHVVQTFDHGVTPEGVAFIVMEKLDGQDLAHRVEQGVLSPKEAALIMTQTCRALGRAHQVGIVHRDIKPDNIFLCDVGSDEPFVKLLDFGIARSMNPKLDNKTRTGAMMGTPYYMSPEQFAGTKDIDHRTDLWSLGIVAYECLTGKRPFDADTIGGLAIAVHSGNFPVPSQIRPDLAAFDPWFLKACARNMADRFQSAKEFADAFNQVARQVSASMPPAAPGNPLAQSFTNTNPEGIPTVAPALLLSTGAGAAIEASPTGDGSQTVIPMTGGGSSKGMVFAIAAVVGLVAIGGTVFALRPHGSPASATAEAPPRVEAPPAPAAPPPVAAPTQAAAAQLAPLPNVTAPAASASVDDHAAAPGHAAAAQHAGSTAAGAAHPATVTPVVAAPSHAAAPAKPAVNCN
ncbi:MAG: serine/threonine protein kinase, partial [Polyangiaceae bacterium]